jgi:hypothetical protein
MGWKITAKSERQPLEGRIAAQPYSVSIHTPGRPDNEEADASWY